MMMMMRSKVQAMVILWATHLLIQVKYVDGFVSSCSATANIVPKVSTSALNYINGISDDEAMNALEHIEHLDGKLGVGRGATKQRSKLNAIIEQWEAQQQEQKPQTLDIYDRIMATTAPTTEDQECKVEYSDMSSAEENCSNYWDVNKYVVKHAPKERIAIFGGDPARRRQTVEKKLSPFKSCDQFGSPKDVGSGDISKLLRKINADKYDVVYVWTRYNCHSSRSSIREACQLSSSKTRFEEVESLAYIREFANQ